MHYRLFILMDKKNAKDSAEAREYVENWLVDEGFCETDKRFAGGISDWFVIGGRWSGEIERLKLDQDKMKKFWKEFEKLDLGWTNNKDKTKDLQKLKTEVLWNKFFPDYKGKIPMWRDTYSQQGYEDDAQIVTKEIWKGLKASFDKKMPKYFDIDDGIIDINFWDGEDIKGKDIVGKKWIVVIDYHN